MHDDYHLNASTFLGFTAAQSTDWLAENAGTALTVGGSIVVAIITVIGALWAKHHTPRQPIPIQDVWSENRSLRADLIGMEARFKALDVDYERSVDIVAVLWRYVQRIQATWGLQAQMPRLSSAERRAIAPLVTDLEPTTAAVPVISD